MHSPSQRLIGAEQIVAQRGKLCVVSPSSGISVVDVATVPPRILPIWLPEEFEPVFIGIFQETIVQELVGELCCRVYIGNVTRYNKSNFRLLEKLLVDLIICSDEHSWKKSRDLLEKVGRQGDLTGYRVSCLLIGAKDDLTPYPRAVQDSVKGSVNSALLLPLKNQLNH
ncbi:hypothetical protein D0Y65_051733 [Glycine soja]|uniref:Uncharacterized protein n=1 Tax=Glycine soja TaxID=3848 RepID=A0A445FHR1_GLYSO|nr:hypothetical protein D0Y65_051733 [Glycine soja]